MWSNGYDVPFSPVRTGFNSLLGFFFNQNCPSQFKGKLMLTCTGIRNPGDDNTARCKHNCCTGKAQPPDHRNAITGNHTYATGSALVRTCQNWPPLGNVPKPKSWPRTGAHKQMAQLSRAIRI